MGLPFLTIAFFGYFALLFIIAFYAEKRERNKKSIVNNPYFYALSLAVYCTAWTYFGSIGRAATTGYGFLPIYLGPTIFAPLWVFFLRKIIRISKAQRINSIADFISSRYGKATLPGVVATIIAIFGIIPYISIQLKGIVFCFDILSGQAEKSYSTVPFYEDSALFITIVLAAFAILFGTRNVDPNERHEGLVAVIAFESVFKVLAFLAAGVFVVFGIYDGFDHLFAQAYANPEVAEILNFSSSGITGESWFFLLLLSGLAVIFLPRQFHVAVVENTNSAFVKKAAWLFPLYLFLINIFVLPIATAGLLQYSGVNVEPDTFILRLPLDHGYQYLAIFIAMGGVSAAASMVIVAVTALTIMLSNNLLIPLVIRYRQLQSPHLDEFHKSLIGIRRIGILVILLLAYGYFKSVGEQYTIASIGLTSFAAVAQFAPAIIGGMYWKRATKTGAVAGMIGGFLIWAFTLPVLNLIEVGLYPDSIMTEGMWGISFLKPQSLFGLEMSDQISHTVFWSLLVNVGLYFFVSLSGKPSAIEVAQADYFVNFSKYQKEGFEQEVIKREANFKSLKSLLIRYLGKEKVRKIFKKFEKKYDIKTKELTIAPTELVNFSETSLAGSLGAASAKIVINSITREEPISFEEMLRILDQTQEVIKYSRQLEISRAELEAATVKLRLANEQLKELDAMKAEFISTVTHELRTPITSIKSLAKIINENPELPSDDKNRFLNIIVGESERLGRIVNQVLDIEKLQGRKGQAEIKVKINLCKLVEKALSSIEKSAEAKDIRLHFLPQQKRYFVYANRDHLIQIIINLLSNALKFCPESNGEIRIELSETETDVTLSVADNGIGIEYEKQAMIFEKFTQVHNQIFGKPDGSGLGLFITKKLTEAQGGVIYVESELGKGATFYIRLPKASIMHKKEMEA